MNETSTLFIKYSCFKNKVRGQGLSMLSVGKNYQQENIFV